MPNYDPFELLGDKARLMIFCLLKTKKECDFQTIQNHLTKHMPKRNTSTMVVLSESLLVIKLGELQKGGLIKIRKNPKDLRSKLYSIDSLGLKKIEERYHELMGD